MKKLTLAAAALCVALGGTVARAQDAGALLDLLVKKRLISDQEAEEVRTELVKESASTAAGKWKLSAPITEIELYGDVRLRYEYRGGRLPSDQHSQDNPNDWYERHRERYRLRVGLRGTLADDWFFGLRLETSASPRSTNVTFGGDIDLRRPIRKRRRRNLRGSGIFRLHGFPGLQVYRRQNATAAHNHVDAVGRRYQSGRPRGAMEAHIYLRPWRRRRRSGSVLQQGRV